MFQTRDTSRLSGGTVIGPSRNRNMPRPGFHDMVRTNTD